MKVPVNIHSMEAHFSGPLKYCSYIITKCVSAYVRACVRVCTHVCVWVFMCLHVCVWVFMCLHDSYNNYFTDHLLLSI